MSADEKIPLSPEVLPPASSTTGGRSGGLGLLMPDQELVPVSETILSEDGPLVASPVGVRSVHATSCRVFEH